ncbi:MAG: hypothetical protein AABW63_02665 [Nanoarchaeota archaeon]
MKKIFFGKNAEMSNLAMTIIWILVFLGVLAGLYFLTKKLFNAG